MENLVPATGRVLRYWYGAMASRCLHHVYDFLGVDGQQLSKSPETDARASWVDAEVWSRPEPGHERTVVLAVEGREVLPRVRMPCHHFKRPVPRRPGTVVRSTFVGARQRLKRARSPVGTGIS